jgi:L-erythrulose 1-phosphate isomerase
MSRPYVFGTNFKMNQTPDESAAFYRQLAERVAPRPGVHCYVIPPYTSLPAVAEIAREDESEIWVGAQNMHWAPEGAYTGEISARILQALDVDLVLLGHAERRGLFHETDNELNRKLMAAFGAGFRVLLAVGETAEERHYGVGAETVSRQLKIDLHGVPAAFASLLLVAYEPVWSIGAGGTPAHPEDVAPVAALIREVLERLLGAPGRDVPVLYGGSVNPENAAAFTSLEDIDGLLVGRAGWTVDGFVATYEAGLAGHVSGSARA